MLEKKLKIFQMIDFYGKLLSSRQLDIIKAYYEDDLSLSEIAENLHISRQAVQDNIKRTEELFEETENKLKLIEKHEQQQNVCKLIKTELESMCNANEQIKHYEVVQQKCIYINKLLNKLN